MTLYDKSATIEIDEHFSCRVLNNKCLIDVNDVKLCVCVCGKEKDGNKILVKENDRNITHQ